MVVQLVNLRTFLAVVEHRGFRSAARRLYLSQPAVTRQVADLEREVGVPLLVRTSTGAEPTAAGLALAEWAQVLLDDHAQALRAARSQPPSGQLVMAIAVGGVGELTAPLLRHLCRALPGLRLRTYDMTLLTWSDVMPVGTDLMITRDPYADDRLRQTVLLSESSAVGVPRQYPEADANRLSLEEVLRLPYARISRRVPATFARYWSLHDHRGGIGADFRGRPAREPIDAPRTILRGEACAVGSALIERAVSKRVSLIPIVGAPKIRTSLVSAIEDKRPLIDAVHREAAWVTRRLGPLVLPELAEPLPL